MSTPFLDLRPAYAELREELDAAYRRVMESGRYVLDREVEAFEAEFAAYCGAQHCVGVGNGFDALHFILRACGVQEGDEVIVPATTFVATWLAVSHVGATPVAVDCDPRTQNLDAGQLHAAIGPRTRAVIVVHLFGQPADLDPILEAGRRHQLAIIEDAAQAHGARYKGRRVGGFGAAAAFSFYPTKNLGALGDAGAVVTNDRRLAASVRMLRNCGATEKYVHEVQGFNSRLDALQAAFLRAKLKHLDDWNERRRRVAQRYLRDLAGIGRLDLPAVPEGSEPVWHLFVVRHASRDELRQWLSADGIETLMHYPVPPHVSGAYAGRAQRQAMLPHAETFARTCLSLPMGPHLPEAQVERVIAGVTRYFRRGPGVAKQLHPAERS